MQASSLVSRLLVTRLQYTIEQQLSAILVSAWSTIGSLIIASPENESAVSHDERARDVRWSSNGYHVANGRDGDRHHQRCKCTAHCRQLCCPGQGTGQGSTAAIRGRSTGMPVVRPEAGTNSIPPGTTASTSGELMCIFNGSHSLVSDALQPHNAAATAGHRQCGTRQHSQ